MRPPRRRNGPAREAGQGTVVILGLLATLSAMTAGWLALGSASIASHTARVAADLGALAGATESLNGGGNARICATARQVAVANQARVLTCWVNPDGTVELTAGARPGLALPGWGGRMAVARSRAGPLVRARAALGP